MPDLWSGSLATKTIGQASVVNAGPMVRVACDPDHWSGISRGCRTTGQASAVDAGPVVRVACDPDHWSGIRRGCRTSGQGRLRPGLLVRHPLLMPDLCSESFATRTLGQASAVEAVGGRRQVLGLFFRCAWAGVGLVMGVVAVGCWEGGAGRGLAL